MKPLLFFILFFPLTLAAQNRLALVIGNGDYSAIGKLHAPHNDADDMASLLKECGFEVKVIKDASRDEMETAINAFGKKLKTQQGVGLFYYSGHGMEESGKNYLMPIQFPATIDYIQQIERQAVPLSLIKNVMTAAGNGQNILLLDACRTQIQFADKKAPIVGNSIKSGENKDAENIFIGYATSVGNEAIDGVLSRNSPFTATLLTIIRRHKGMELVEIYRHVISEIKTQFPQQQPTTEGITSASFYFFPPITTPLPKDSDKDGIVDEIDKCPQLAGDLAYMGCPAPSETLAKEEIEEGKKNFTKGDYEAAFALLYPHRNHRYFDATAQDLLGWMYEKGRGVAQSDTKAVEWHQKSADQGNAHAQNSLGYMYENGRGVAKSDSKAVEWYQKSADQGYATAQCNLGVMYENGRGIAQSDTKAVEWYQKSANQGYAAGQCYLGVMYANGRGVAQSDTKAVEWYQKSANQGYAAGQCYLGLMYKNGHGVTQSDTKAVEWFQKSAGQGESAAQYDLGWMYENGRGVTQSDTKAVEWYQKSANQGYADAQSDLGVMYVKGRGVAQSDTKAVEWYQQSANQGNANGQYNLGTMYEGGKGGLLSNKSEAVRLYRLAARQSGNLAGIAAAKKRLQELGESL